MLKLKSLILTLGLILALSSIIRAYDQTTDLEIGIVEHLNDFLPKEIWVTNEDGKLVNLVDEIDKPTIINMVYYRCPGVCTPLMDGLADVIDKSNMLLDHDYQVLTVSFDYTEGIDLAKSKKANYLAQMNKKNSAEKGWKFFVSDSTNIARITDAIGFKFKRAGNDFLHAASIVFVNKEKMICRYLNGTYFLPIELKMSVIEANKGNSMPTVNRVLQFCYSYDPVGQAYVLNVTKISATLILCLAVVVFLFLIFKPRRKKD